MQNAFSRFGFTFLLLNSLLVFLVSPVAAQKKEHFGFVEKVLLYPDGLPLHAKLDTGADNSSLDASDVESFEKDGVEWVRFHIRNRYGQRINFEKEVRRVAMIKRHSKKHQRRKVIRVGVCLGSTYLETDVNLVDRTNFAYQMLLGRTFLAGNAVVDPALTYTTEPHCQAPKRGELLKKKEAASSVSGENSSKTEQKAAEPATAKKASKEKEKGAVQENEEKKAAKKQSSVEKNKN